VGAALALYLVSFVLAFDHPRWYVRPLFIASLVVLLPAMAYFVPSLNLAVAAPLYLAGLFAVCMFCTATWRAQSRILRISPAFT